MTGGWLLAAGAISLAAQQPRQYDAQLLDNAFVRAHIVILNTVEHFRAAADGPQLFYCLHSFLIVHSERPGAIERCARGQLVFEESGWLDFKADADPRPEMLVLEIKQPPAGDFFVASNDGTRLAPDVYRRLLDNPIVRVMEMTLPRGAQVSTHRRTGRMFEFPLTSAVLRLTTPGAAMQAISIRARAPRWTLDAVEQSVDNDGPTDYRAILVELK